jgi:hypothetical protein
MKLLPEEMVLFELDYGELVRPAFEILSNWGWGQCTNQTSEFLVVYGPKHKSENSIFDTSPYVLPPGATTPNQWDCDGFLLPSEESFAIGAGSGTARWPSSFGTSGGFRCAALILGLTDVP